MDLSRRSVLSAGLVLGATTLTGLSGQLQGARAARALLADPFRLGVASGDPSPGGIVLWTRLALHPLASDGLGGMPNRHVDVHWQVATDPAMQHVVRHGTAVARPAYAHAIHVVLGGLSPGREYWYRFRAEGHLSRIGRTRTTPATDAHPSALELVFASCAQFTHGYFTAYRKIAAEHPDLVLHLGDYIYEYGADRNYPITTVRTHAGPDAHTLANYRQRYAQYKTDRDLQAAQAAAPWLVTFDDHEVEDGWAGVYGKPFETQQLFMRRRAAAFRAYYENMPLRRTSVPSGPDIRMYRRVHWGDLATLHLLDTRQFRDDQACGSGYRIDCDDADLPARTITGTAQENWLIDGFRSSTARWDLLGQQVFFAQRDGDERPDHVGAQMDTWDGYAASRRRVTKGWVDAGVRNPVVLTGDIHEHWAANLKLDYDAEGPVVGTELVTSSISSNGDGEDAPLRSHPWLPWNPHLRFQNNLRGYVRARITPTSLEADFRALRKVTRRDQQVFTRASVAIADQEPGVQLTADNPA
jgi:alkaline phosphatase D